MYVCMYLCMWLCMYVCMYVCMSVCLYVCMSVCMYVCMYDCLSLCLSVCHSVGLSVCVYVCATRTNNALKQCQASAGVYTTPGGGLIRDLVPKKWGPLLADVLLFGTLLTLRLRMHLYPRCRPLWLQEQLEPASRKR